MEDATAKEVLGHGELLPILPGAGRERLRALPAHRRAARAAEDARGDGAPRRAAVPDGAPVLGAVAQARRASRPRRRSRASARTTSCWPCGCWAGRTTASSSRPTRCTCSSGSRPGSTTRCGAALGHGSGFDSPGWRKLRRLAPPLWQAFTALLARARPRAQRRLRARAAAPSLYDLAEALIEFDERIAIWRSVHVKMVQRVIGGGAIGTQGTPVAVLAGMTTKELFPQLWAVRNRLTEIAGT